MSPSNPPNQPILPFLHLALYTNNQPDKVLYDLIDATSKRICVHTNPKELWLDTIILLLCGIETYSLYATGLNSLLEINPLIRAVSPHSDETPPDPTKIKTEDIELFINETAFIETLQQLIERIQTRIHTGEWFAIDEPPSNQYFIMTNIIQNYQDISEMLDKTHTSTKDKPNDQTTSNQHT